MISICRFYREATTPDGFGSKHKVCDRMVKVTNEIKGIIGELLFKTPARNKPYRPSGCPYELRDQESKCEGFEPNN